MKKLFAVLIATMMLLSLTACGEDQEPSYDAAQEKFEEIAATDNKKEIEDTIKSVFGVKVSLPEAESYMSNTISSEESSIYMVTLVDAAVTPEELFEKLASAFSGWTATESTLTYSKETDTVLYGAVIAEEGDYLTIAFSMTDMEVIGEFMGASNDFYAEIKKLSGVEIAFPDIVTSIGLPSGSNDGAQAHYGGMLLSGSSNLDEAGFEAIADSLDSQLDGFTREEVEAETWGAARVIRWTDDTDKTRYFELELYDFEGVQYVEFAFHYTDRSLLVAWPGEQIDKFFGKATGIPPYSGNYEGLEVYEYVYDPDEEYSDYADHISVEMTWTEEEEMEVWLAELEQTGFVKSEDDWGGVKYYKDLGDGLFVKLNAYRETYGGSLDLTFEKEQLTGLEWPAAQIEENYGSAFASLLPAVPQATRRTFTMNKDTVYIYNNFDSTAFNAYCDTLVGVGFTETTRDESYAKYTHTFENYDRVAVSVSFEKDNSSVYVDYEAYEGPGFTLPENALIEYTFAYANNLEATSSFKIVKIGENYHFSGGYFGSYYEYDEAGKVWYKYSSMTFDETTEWSKSEETMDRYAVDKALKNSMSYIFFEKGSYHNEDTSKNKTVQGSPCTAYTSGSYTYWVSDDTGLLFDQSAIWVVTVTVYDTSIQSFADAGITADMLPSE